MSLQNALMNTFGDDPFYKDVIVASNKEQMKVAVKALTDARGDMALKQITNFSKKFMIEKRREA